MDKNTFSFLENSNEEENEDGSLFIDNLADKDDNSSELELLEMLNEEVDPKDMVPKKEKKRFFSFQKPKKISLPWEKKPGFFKKTIKKVITKKEYPEILTLRRAYEILDIGYFPVSHEEVRMAYYAKEIPLALEEDKIALLKRARKLVFENINTNPFEEEGECITEEIKEEAEEVVKETEKDLKPKDTLKFKYQKHFKQKKEKNTDPWKELSRDLYPEKNESKQPQQKAAKEDTKELVQSHKKTLIICSLFFVGLLALVYVEFKKLDFKEDSSEEYISLEELNPIEKEEQKEETLSEKTSLTDKDMGIAKSLDLLCKDGLELQNIEVYFTENEITDYHSDSFFIPFINLCLLKREFGVNKPHISYRVDDISLYRFTGSNEANKAWEKIFNQGKVKVEDVELSGTWKGSGASGNGRYPMEEASLEITGTKNGYMKATLSFVVEGNKKAMLTMEGLYNAKRNEFTLEPRDWKIRPNLFMAPTLWGMIDLNENKLISIPKTTKVQFELSGKKSTDSANPSKEVIEGLLKTQTAMYQTHKIALSNLKITTLSKSKIKDNVYNLSLAGTCEEGIGSYQVSGTIKVKQINGIWVVENTDLQAKLTTLLLEGNYKGLLTKEESEYPMEAVITKEEEGYQAVIKIKGKYLPFITSIETRKVKVNDHKITLERTDIIKGKIIGTSLVEGKLNYEKSAFLQSSGEEEFYLKKIQ